MRAPNTALQRISIRFGGLLLLRLMLLGAIVVTGVFDVPIDA
jgi:hypothetical protein